MLISLLSFLLILSSSSVSITIEKKCSTNNDCDRQLISNTETKICTCPKSYFWRDDIRSCSGCAPGWIDLNTKQCLLFAVTHLPGVTWYQAETTCNGLLARPLTINNIDEFRSLKQKIDYLSNGFNVLTANVYFYKGAWVRINESSRWSELYPWCNNTNKRDSFDCVQLRQDNTICLQYVSCIEKSHFICEASSVLQSVLEKNIAENKRAVINNSNEEIKIKLFRRAVTVPASAPRPVVAPAPAPAPGHQIMMTTKKSSSFSFDGFANILNSAFSAVGHVSNAIGSYYGSKQQNQQSNVIDTSYNQMPQALTDDDSGIPNIVIYGGLIFGGLLILTSIIIITICCLKKTNKSESRSSIRSSESYTSEG